MEGFPRKMLFELLPNGRSINICKRKGRGKEWPMESRGKKNEKGKLSDLI